MENNHATLNPIINVPIRVSIRVIFAELEFIGKYINRAKAETVETMRETVDITLGWFKLFTERCLGRKPTRKNDAITKYKTTSEGMELKFI